MYKAEILADSVSQHGIRLVTALITFPRFILAEVNTHRVLSRNSASSRAIPPERHFEKVMENPFVPDVFCERIKGMGQGEPIEDQERAKMAWLDARDFAVHQATILMELGISKAHVNRILEPFLWHTAIITATDWDNFFALRAPSGDEVDLEFPAQPEFQRIAIDLRRAMRESDPIPTGTGGWHLPLVTEQEIQSALDMEADLEELARISAGRCARVSFERQDEYEDPGASLERAKKLEEAGHLSPFEHQATPLSDEQITEIEVGDIVESELAGNLRGWVQLRKYVDGEDNHGALVGRPSWEH